MLPRRHRLTRPAEYRAVLRRGGVRSGTPLLVVHVRLDDAPTRPPRVGFVVSRAVGNAVVRNRVTRRLRHLMAPRLQQLPPGTDVVVRANPDAARAGSPELAAALDRGLAKVLARAGVLA